MNKTQRVTFHSRCVGCNKVISALAWFASVARGWAIGVLHHYHGRQSNSTNPSTTMTGRPQLLQSATSSKMIQSSHSRIWPGLVLLLHYLDFMCWRKFITTTQQSHWVNSCIKRRQKSVLLHLPAVSNGLFLALLMWLQTTAMRICCSTPRCLWG